MFCSYGRYFVLYIFTIAYIADLKNCFFFSLFLLLLFLFCLCLFYLPCLFKLSYISTAFFFRMVRLKKYVGLFQELFFYFSFYLSLILIIYLSRSPSLSPALYLSHTHIYICIYLFSFFISLANKLSEIKNVPY